MREDAESKNALRHQKKRRKHKIKLALTSIGLFIIAGIILLTYFTLTKNEYNKYTENAKVDYKVNLNENEFYQNDYLNEENTIIASLIKDITVNFKYNLDFEKEQAYKYSYKIVAKTNVKENKKSNSIYETTDELVNKEIEENTNNNLEITEEITVNYNEYNDKINKFVNLYRLDDTVSTLELDMYVYAISKYDETQINKESKVMTINIPLTTRTVDISIGSNVVQDEGKILSKKSEYQNIEYVLIIGIAIAILGIIIFIRFIKYLINTRSAETMYEQELKMILFNYKTYIQKTSSEINQEGYKVIEINTFDEILSLRDTMQSPILMYTEENERRTKFMIMNEGILYIYVLGAKEIREVLRKKSAEMKKRKK